jgi:hypothetical protein
VIRADDLRVVVLSNEKSTGADWIVIELLEPVVRD